MWNALSVVCGAFSAKGEADKDGFEDVQCSCHPGYVGCGLNLVWKVGKTFIVELCHILKAK